MTRFEGSVGFQAKLRELFEEYIDVLSTRVRHQSAKVAPLPDAVSRLCANCIEVEIYIEISQQCITLRSDIWAYR